MIEQVADADPVLGGDGQNVADPQAAIILEMIVHLLGIHLVDGEQNWLAALKQQAGKLVVGRGQGSAAIDDHDDERGFTEREACLAKDFGGDESLVLGKNTSGIDHASALSQPLDLPVNAVAGDARLVPDNRPPRAGQAIEEAGLADVGPSNNGNERRAGGERPRCPLLSWRGLSQLRGAQLWTTQLRPGMSGSMRRSGPWRLTGNFRGPGARAPGAVAPPVRPAAFFAAARLASARDCSLRFAGAERCAAFATAARLPPFECGFGFLPLVPLGGFKRCSCLAIAGSYLQCFIQRGELPQRT